MDKQPQSPGLPASFRRGVFFTSIGSLVVLVALFVETVIAVRILSRESFGVYVLLTTLVSFLMVGIDFGTKTATTQMIASSDESRQAMLANMAIVFRLLVSSVICAFIWLAQSLLIALDPSLAQYLVYVPFMLAVASFDELFLGLLQGFQRYRNMAVAQIVRSVARLCLTSVFLIVFKLDVMALVYSWIASFALSATYQFLVLPFSKHIAYQRRLLKEVLRFGFPIYMHRFLWFVFRRIDVMLLGTLAGSASVAYYAVAARIPDALQNLFDSFSTVYFPTMTTLLADGRRGQAEEFLDRSLRLISFAVALVALIAVVFSQQIVVLLFSEKYAASYTAFAVLMLALHMAFIVNLLGYTLTAAGHPEYSLGQEFTRSTLNILGDLLLIPVFSFIGPALATLIAAYGANPLSMWLLRRSGVMVKIAPYGKQTLLLLLCSALFWWVQPASFGYKFGFVVLFVILAVALSTISWHDLGLVLPESLLKRRGMINEVEP